MDLNKLIIWLCRACGCMSAGLAVYGICTVNVSYTLFFTLGTVVLAYLGVIIEDDIKHFDD